MAIDLSATAIDPGAAAYRPLLADLQGNILKAHGRDHAAHVFVRFTAPAEAARAWVRAVAAEHVTSALDQLRQHAVYRAGARTGGLFGAFFLSAAGYRALGFDVDRFQDEGETFRNGMKYQSPEPVRGALNAPNRDPAPDTWEAGFQQEVHAMVLVADDAAAAVEAAAGALAGAAARVGAVVCVEVGHVLRNQELRSPGNAAVDRKGQPIEHFGFIDGRSNPLFLAADVADEVGGIDRYDPRAPLGLVLTPDPFGGGEDSYGSYFVFRKLRQDVAGFDRAVADLASQLGVTPTLAGALVVGRFPDGTPVTLRDRPGLGDVNNFKYAREDGYGNRCPYHAHIRKVNPRGTTPFTALPEERARRIVRRGIPYGRKDAPGPDGIGLLFMCYQSDIRRQFEFVQRLWADNPNFPTSLLLPDTGPDAVIGQARGDTIAPNWPGLWGTVQRTRCPFGQYVTLRGGEYFFAPSLSFLLGG